MTLPTTNSGNADGAAFAPFGPEMVRRYREQGFLILPEFLSASELEQLRDLYDDVMDRVTSYLREKSTETEEQRAERRAKGYMIPVNRPEKIRPELLETAAYHRARQLVAEMTDIDPDRLVVHGRIWHKPAGVGLPTPWHQDEPTFGRKDITVSATVSVALDPATPESGCLNYIPISFNEHENVPHLAHEQEAQAGFTGTDTYYEADPDEIDESLAVPGAVPAGGATMHHCRTLHCAGWNRSEEPRRSLAIRYSLHRDD